MRTLVLHYSRTGTADRVAAALAERLGGDRGEIICDAYEGVLGAFRMAGDVMRRGNPPIRVTVEPAGYDHVIVGGPVWAARPDAPLRSFLLENQDASTLAGVFLVHGTPDASEAESEVRRLAGRSVAFAEFRTAEVKSGAYGPALEVFALKLERAVGQEANFAGSNA